MQPIRIKACSESDLRMLGNLARNIQRVLPVTQADIDAAAALGKGWVVWKVIEVNDPIDNLRGGTQLVIKQNSITPGQNVRRVLIVQGPGGETVVVGPGPSPLLLPDAIANSLSYVKAFGGTEQNGTPTPDSPMDIVSNNGVLKVSPNLFDKNASYALFNGYLNNVIAGQDTVLNSYDGGDKTIIIKVAPNTTYTVTRATNLGSVYDRIRCAAFTTLPVPRSAGVMLCNYMNTTQASATFTTLSDTQYVAINVRNSGAVGDDWTQYVDAFQLEQGSTATPYMPYGQIYTDGTVETINAHGKNLFDKNNVLVGYYDGSGVWNDAAGFKTADYIPAKPNTTYVASVIGIQGGVSGFRLNAWDKNHNWLGQVAYSVQSQVGQLTVISGTSPANTTYLSLGFSISHRDIDTCQLEQGSTATEYQPYYDGGTATAEMLLKVGDYQDEQEILSGAVTRNVGVKVLDGTEDWTRTDVRTKLVLADSATGSANWQPYCTHYQGFLGSASIGSMPDNSCKINVNTNELLIKDTTHNTDLATWTQWLADQATAGTPVIVIYPLATPTTESVAGQTLQVEDGDNTLEITQASLSGLELEAEYTKVA